MKTSAETLADLTWVRLALTSELVKEGGYTNTSHGIAIKGMLSIYTFWVWNKSTCPLYCLQYEKVRECAARKLSGSGFQKWMFISQLQGRRCDPHSHALTGRGGGCTVSTPLCGCLLHILSSHAVASWSVGRPLFLSVSPTIPSGGPVPKRNWVIKC